MALSASIVEQIAAWCATNEVLDDTRLKARNEYFGNNEPGEVHYIPGAGDATSRERRFLGWFTLTFTLPDGRKPAELAAAAILKGSELASAVDSIKRTRHVLAMVAMVNPGKGLILRLEDEEFVVDNRQLSRLLNRGEALYAHIIPAGRRGWLVGPGWLQWPIGIMPGLQAMLKKFQLSPIELERFLQQRGGPSKDHAKVELPRDSSLQAAVARMTAEATAAGKSSLIRSVEEWESIVLASMNANDIKGFSQKIVQWVGNVPSLDDLNRWIGLAMNIWNTTTQPDRGGRTADQIFEEQKSGARYYTQ